MLRFYPHVDALCPRDGEVQITLCFNQCPVILPFHLALSNSAYFWCNFTKRICPPDKIRSRSCFWVALFVALIAPTLARQGPVITESPWGGDYMKPLTGPGPPSSPSIARSHRVPSAVIFTPCDTAAGSSSTMSRGTGSEVINSCLWQMFIYYLYIFGIEGLQSATMSARHQFFSLPSELLGPHQQTNPDVIPSSLMTDY